MVKLVADFWPWISVNSSIGILLIPCPYLSWFKPFIGVTWWLGDREKPAMGKKPTTWRVCLSQCGDLCRVLMSGLTIPGLLEAGKSFWTSCHFCFANLDGDVQDLGPSAHSWVLFFCFIYTYKHIHPFNLYKIFCTQFFKWGQKFLVFYY